MVILSRWSAAMAALGGIVSIYHRWLHVNPTTVALTLLLFILLLAAKWGLRYAVGVSLVATVSYNYFFLPPVGTFTISDPQNWLALFAFLVTAVTASRLSARIREEEHEAQVRRREVEILFHLSRELLQTDKVTELINSVPSSIALVSDASGVLLYLSDGDRLYRAGDVGPRIELPMLQELMLISVPRKLDEGRAVAVSLRAGVKPRGVLIVAGLSLSDGTLDALAGLVSIAIDRAQALEDVTRVEAAKENERLRNVMLDSITHELRTPLGSIKTAITTLLSSDVNAEDRQKLLLSVDEESGRLNHLVAQSVEMTQLDSREIQMQFVPSTMEQLIATTLAPHDGTTLHQRVRVDLPKDLPKVLADPAWIAKVLQNLLDNACKFSAAATPITLSAEAREGVVAISVADSGIGIDSQDQAMIFDKFYRAQSPSQRVPGTGMGLSICRAIVESHGGSISVVSQPGRGSVFTFTLPLSPA
ncbi:sensor histidine kinase [Granulicella arctica]|uniref:sensor histidine kinase n=1 Tax=Granulicella arctica TaxID=940613 RepID=UPI0021E0DA11|nr:ATP-binding protein [Granulicella arctica]